jgi:hypothetical protein
MMNFAAEEGNDAFDAIRSGVLQRRGVFEGDMAGN